ncbi:septum site-determining protein Ssd [Georgenia wangjunii]|uniref:septum site-determining protein Ssd n=1 Tax=Georgenia wangjunii TaxID=3117730 RepID=UPI002F25F28E
MAGTATADERGRRRRGEPGGRGAARAGGGPGHHPAGGGPAGGGGPARVALRSGDRGVVEHVRRLAALAGLELDVHPWGAPPPAAAVLVDDVAAPPGHDAPWGDAPVGGLVVAVAPAGADVGAEVLRLPAESEALLGVLIGAGAPVRARVLGVVGARGGAGASVLAAVVARLAVGAGVPTALVDLDPCGGGLDVLLGLEHDPGPRWADVLAERGGFPPERLVLSLPSWHSVRVLSSDVRSGVPLDDVVARAAVHALACAVDLLVLDLPRHVLAPPGRDEDVPAWLAPCTDVVLVAGCDVRSAAAADGAARALGAAGVVPRLVVSGPAPGGVHAEDVAEVTGLTLVTAMRPERSFLAGLERGLSPGDQRRGPLVTAGRRVLDALEVVP